MARKPVSGWSFATWSARFLDFILLATFRSPDVRWLPRDSFLWMAVELSLQLLHSTTLYTFRHFFFIRQTTGVLAIGSARNFSLPTQEVVYFWDSCRDGSLHHGVFWMYSFIIHRLAPDVLGAHFPHASVWDRVWKLPGSYNGVKDAAFRNKLCGALWCACLNDKYPHMYKSQSNAPFLGCTKWIYKNKQKPNFLNLRGILKRYCNYLD